MNTTTEKEPVIKADQLPDAPEDNTSIAGANPNFSEPIRSSMAEVAEISSDEIVDLKNRKIPLPAQPPGVFAAIAEEVNKLFVVIAAEFTQDDLASFLILQSDDLKGEVGQEAQAIAYMDGLRKALPKFLAAAGKKGPETLCKVVSMILEPDPLKIKNGDELMFPADKIEWEISTSEQINAVIIYIDSLELGSFKKKLMALRG